ncbi:MAG: serine/threonine protein kinase [Phycisphaerales bacterium]|nr:serine/threonine protein kinase [Phycisphaerales bacterium]MCB9856893.1 serine/threonine protein kinase [Phycisphaerales bacterium]MCB9861980.1 serine/threonine protein kinase [Phycisphaerales bacterium]
MSDSPDNRLHRWTQIETLFHEALEQPPATRAEYLSRRCPDDDQLRGEVERLLAGHDNAAHFIEPPAEGFLSSDLTNDLDIPVEGKRIGRYALKRVIASGGMGTVYEAEQENPKRSVAIKVLRGGIASRNVLRRFEHEAAVLAHLRHPVIAQVLEAGTHIDEGERRPFFAMEYIPDALPITDFVEQKKLSIEDRLTLFVSICEAVHYGHQRGIIHRDLKPANILVDGSGRPKVIDFGVARVLDSDIAVTTMQTGVGQLIGTLTYMSPEQCSGDPHDIDTRSDVYSLGIVLYEMLCGRLPYDVRNKAITEVAALIQDQPPRRPSSVNRLLRGDLETITLKAIEKDCNYRYQSALELASDIRRFLAKEPISARPPSMTYQLRMFARRNRVLVASAGVFVVLVTLSSIVMTSLYWQKSNAMVEVQRQQALAEKNAAAEREQRALAEANADAERLQRTKAERMMAYLKEMLSSADPETQPGHETTVREVLDRVAPRLHSELASQPEVEAEMHDVIGATYYALGIYDKAEMHGRRAMEILREIAPDSPAYAKVLSDLAAVITTVGRLDEAKGLFEQALAIRERTIGRDTEDTAQSYENLAEVARQQRDFVAAEQLIRESLAILGRLPEKNKKRMSLALNSLALTVESGGRRAEAERYYLAALELVDDENDLNGATIRNNLAGLYLDQGDMNRAEVLLLEAKDIYRRVLGDEHLHVGHALNNLGVLYTEMQRLDEAEAMQAQAYAIYRLRVGEYNRHTATSLNNRGSILVDEGRMAEARPVLLKALEIRLAILPDLHPEIAATLNNLARIELSEGHADEVERLVEESLCIQMASLPPLHPNIAAARTLMGRIYSALGRRDDAIEQYRLAVSIFEATRPAGDRRLIELRIGIGRLLAEAGRTDEAEQMLLLAFDGANSAGGLVIPYEASLIEMIEDLPARSATAPEKGRGSSQSIAVTENATHRRD